MMEFEHNEFLAVMMDERVDEILITEDEFLIYLNEDYMYKDAMTFVESAKTIDEIWQVLNDKVMKIETASPSA